MLLDVLCDDLKKTGSQVEGGSGACVFSSLYSVVQCGLMRGWGKVVKSF